MKNIGKTKNRWRNKKMEIKDRKKKNLLQKDQEIPHDATLGLKRMT